MNTRKNSSFKIYTLGCKVNQYDSQEIRERLLESGLREAAKGRKADIYIVNTCTVTQKADRDSLYYVHRSHRENPRALIGVTGCLAETDAPHLRKQPGVGLVLGNKNKLVSRIIKARCAFRSGISFFEGHTRAFLKIQDGCNNFCSYCKVPLVRGISRSKPLSLIVREAQQLIDNGYREIVLTGICLGSYGRDLKPASSLVRVIDALEKLAGLWRIRLSSIEAKDVSDDLVRRLGASKKLCRHIHIPIQSGDNTILRAMRRRYTRKDYIDLVVKIKRACPGIAITTDVLVGFPGEQERHFLNTIDLVKKIVPLRAHIFPFSPRPGTQAFLLKNALALDIMKDRLIRMQRIAESCSALYQRKFLGKIMPVLFEMSGNDKSVDWEGYTDNYLKVTRKSARNLENRLIPLRLRKVEGEKILGILP
jgi:threonylcarbamoyladenosine tRNA methylthiotransferase MtaB